ncbi:MAG TPA: 3-oxoacyl-[acyl-carrier-protein] synthase III C-terminal domain-containing protein [Polyangiaceae bacterium]
MTESVQMIGSTKAYPKGRCLRLGRNASVLGTGAGLPEEVVTNQDLIDELSLMATDRAVRFSVGIHERRRGSFDVTCAEYLAGAALECCERARLDPERIDRIIYARLFGDHSIPATSLRVLQRLGLTRRIPVMDISAACSGFLHAMELGLSYINAGDDHVLILGGDRGAMAAGNLVAKDTRTVFLNGDGFAAMLLGATHVPKFRSSYFYTDSDLADFAQIPFGTALLNQSLEFNPEMLTVKMPDGRKIHQSVLDSCRIVSSRLLELASMTWNDIDFLITSDQTHLVWKDQLAVLGLPESKSVSCFHKYGNTVAAMAPLNLNEAIITGKLTRGMTVMMMGHGAGASGGGFIFEY